MDASANATKLGHKHNSNGKSSSSPKKLASGKQGSHAMKRAKSHHDKRVFLTSPVRHAGSISGNMMPELLTHKPESENKQMMIQNNQWIKEQSVQDFFSLFKNSSSLKNTDAPKAAGLLKGSHNSPQRKANTPDKSLNNLAIKQSNKVATKTPSKSPAKTVASQPKAPEGKSPFRKGSFGGSEFYAGAGFDRSPAANTLPIPTFLSGSSRTPTKSPINLKISKDSNNSSLQTSPSNRPTILAKSCPNRTESFLDTFGSQIKHHVGTREAANNTGLKPNKQANTNNDDGKSDKKVSSGKSVDASPTIRKKSPPHDLEEMTNQVRRMLKLS